MTRHRFLWNIAALAAALILLVALAAGVAWSWSWEGPARAGARYVGRQECTACHADVAGRWDGSDHQLAMAPATPANVRGDFNNRKFTHFGVTSTMTRQGDRFFMTTDGPDGRLQTYAIKYTFGWHPLQQYLVEFSTGRVQCLPVAWDTEGKRWFHLYPDEPIPASDVLHWTRPLQNWNYMCAECHSTDLQRKFDLPTTLAGRKRGVPPGLADTYHTTFAEINVSCETCHGPGSVHGQWAQTWRRHLAQPGAMGLPFLKSSNPRIEIETCAPCHARRRIIYPGFTAGEKFLDYYMPEMLDTEVYYPDGQIRDEDYEYGSFLQSKMYRNQVRCSNCHDPHTLRVKFKEGDKKIADNRLCAQCHLPSKFDVPAHHHHPGKLGTPGTLCIECHMPKTTYMVVDPRLDHSIRIPRPDLTVSLGIPNACNGCHHDAKKHETPQWAEETVRKWYGPLQGPPHFAYAIAAGRQGKPEGAGLLDAVARRKDLGAIVRGSALLLLSRYGAEAVEPAAALGLEDPEELVRVAAVRSLQELPPQLTVEYLGRMLTDPVRAVRLEAARILSTVPQASLPPRLQPALDAALQQYMAGQQSLSEQPGAHLCRGVIDANLRQPEKAREEYQIALELDPAFVPGRINLAMLDDTQGQKAEAEKEFRRVIQLEPKMAEAYYSLGLLVAEDEKRLPEAEALLKQAAELAPQNARMHYNYGLALQKQEKYDAAEAQLKRALELAPAGSADSTTFLHALAILNFQQHRWDRALRCAEELVRRQPRDRELQGLLEAIRHEMPAGQLPGP